VRVWLLLVLGFASAASAEGLVVQPWSGDAELGAALDEPVRRALRRVHPRLIDARGPCDVDCARGLGASGVVARAARKGGFGEPLCVELRLRPLTGEVRSLALCRSSAAELARAVDEEVTPALRPPLQAWRGEVHDIRDGELDAELPAPEPRRSPPPAVENAVSTTGLWTMGVGGAVAVAGAGTSIGLLFILNDPSADRGAKDVALHTGRVSLFAGVSVGLMTAATGALIWGIGQRGAP
jgi:hypothetical protein